MYTQRALRATVGEEAGKYAGTTYCGYSERPQLAVVECSCGGLAVQESLGETPVMQEQPAVEEIVVFRTVGVSGPTRFLQ
jgi:hypothetical protein